MGCFWRCTYYAQKCNAEDSSIVILRSWTTAAQDMIYQKNMLKSIGLKVELPMVLEMDNKGAVNQINSFSVEDCTQHIDVKQQKY
jgi:hypothetical protein